MPSPPPLQIACSSDAHCIEVCTNLQNYCRHQRCRLTIQAEVLQMLNVAYVLPLCSMMEHKRVRGAGRAVGQGG